MPHSLTDLGPLEREILNVVWRLGATTAEGARAQLSRPSKESTVRTVLRRLEEKGYLSHVVKERAYIYRAREARGKTAAKAVKRILDRFCNGSLEEVLVGMVDAAMVDGQELRRLAEKIAKSKGRTST